MLNNNECTFTHTKTKWWWFNHKSFFIYGMFWLNIVIIIEVTCFYEDSLHCDY